MDTVGRIFPPSVANAPIAHGRVYCKYFSSTLFSWQMNSISSSSGASRQLTRTVQGFV